MAKIEPDPTLLSVAEAVADGLPVDWPGVATNRPELARDLGRLELIERLAEAYRAVPTPKADSGAAAATTAAAGASHASRPARALGGVWIWIAAASFAGAIIAAVLWFSRPR